jgi:elongation factor P
MTLVWTIIGTRGQPPCPRHGLGVDNPCLQRDPWGLSAAAAPISIRWPSTRKNRRPPSRASAVTPEGNHPVPSYNTSEFKKGLKVQIDGDPYIMIECNFVKPGKGQALYKCKLRNLLRNTVLDRTYKSGDSLDAADITTIDAQFLYKQGEMFVFMDQESYEQYELSKEQVDDSWKWIKEGTVCSMLLYNGNPISMEPPNHMVLKIEYAEPAVRGNTATNLSKPVKLETGAEVIVPAFIEQGDLIKIDTRTGEYLERVKA